MEHQPKLLVFDTHPIQYRAPVFRELAKKLPSLKVFFFNSDFDGNQWWFHEVGTAKSLSWGINLTNSYPNETLNTHQLRLSDAFRKLQTLLIAERPSAIVVYGYYLKEHWILRILSAKLNIPLIFIGETFPSNSSLIRKILTRPLQQYFLKGVHHFVSIGNKTESFYLSKKIPSSKITNGKYCIDTEFFKREEPLASIKREELRKNLGIKESDFVLLFVGRLFDRKRPQDIIALHEILLPNQKVHTIIIGTGPMEASLKAESDGLPRLHWLGFQNQLQTRDWYFAADLLVVPSQFETWGLVVNEAFSCGLPALVSDTCGVADDLVDNGKTGFVYRLGALESAKDYVNQLIENKVLQQDLAKKAREKVLSSYRPDQFAESILKAFRQVTEKTRLSLNEW